jgi:hypothetical protein
MPTGLSEERCNWSGIHWLLLGLSLSPNMRWKALSAGFQRTVHRRLPCPVGSRLRTTR